MADVIPERQNTTNCVCWADFCYAFGLLRRFSRVRPRPPFFNVYTVDMLVAAHGLVLHQYANDCQIYIATPVNEISSAVDRLTRCLNDVTTWWSASRLRLYPAKTQILWLGSRYLVSDIAVLQVLVPASSVTVADSAHDLGVVIDSCLMMADHGSTSDSAIMAPCTSFSYLLTSGKSHI